MAEVIYDGAARAEEILRGLGLSADGLTRSASGFRNEVWLAPDAVVKLYGGNTEGFRKEKWYYQRTQGAEVSASACRAFSPELLGVGEDYLALGRVRGVGLYRAWRGMDETLRGRVIVRAASIMRALDAIDISGACAETCADGSPGGGFDGSDFAERIRRRIHGATVRLRENGGAPEELISRAERYADEHIGALHGSRLRYVYADMHFDNLLVRPDGSLALIDYEMAELAPRDYVLDVWRRMETHPHIYANEEDDPLTRPEDFAGLTARLRRCAPEFFEHPRLSERLRLYGIRYELDILAKYPRSSEPLERLAMNLAE